MSAAGSVGAEASGSVVDFSDFEHQKENIQPLRRGRSAHTLAQLYAGSKEGSTLGSDSRHSLQPHRPLQPRTAAAAEAAPAAEGAGMKMTSQLQERNAQFQAEIAQLDVAESDDPLDVYHRYVGWLLEVFPQAHGHQMIIKLVEAPLKLFRDQERYRNDARYVKMWVWYTEIIADGQEAVFQFLVANKVGDSLALLYEEYAKLLEALGKTQKADEVYQLGINRKAQPLSRLQRRFDEFQRRVVAQTARSMELQQQQQQQPDGEPGPPGPSGGGQQAADENAGHSRSQQAPHRTMLGTKRSSRSVRSAAANTLPQSQRGLAAGQGPAPRPNARIAVFSDPDGAGEPKAVSAAGPWRDIGSDEGRRKENVREAVSWRGQRLEQRRGAAPPTAAAAGAAAPYAVPAAEKFTVFCDSADEDGGASDAAAAPGAALAPRVPGESSSVVGHSMLSSSSSGLLQALEAGGRAAKPRRAKAKGEERMVMPGELLFPAGDGVVQCAEEARAQLARYRFDYELWQRAEAASRAARSAYSDEDDEDQGIADESCFGASRRKSVAPSSPTINTRVAQKDMLGIWNDISDSDSDGAGVLRLRRGDARPDGSAGPDGAARGRSWRSGSSSGGGGGSAVVDDDYQFTMGPVTPHVVPPEQARLPPVIPTSARLARFESFVDHGDGGATGGGGEDNPPTLVLNTIRAAKRREMQQAHTRPTPLAMRAQAPRAGSASAGPAVRQRSDGSQPARGLRSIDESSEAEDGDDCDAHPLMRALEPATPHSARIPVFRDSGGGGGAHSTAQPRPLFGARSSSASALERDYPPIRGQGVLHSTPGHTKTSTGLLASGMELTGLSGFTGLSTIGGPTTMTFAAHQGPLAEEQDEDDDDEDDDEDGDLRPAAVRTPMRKRLSMAAKDLGRITPRFPKTPPGPADGRFGGGMADAGDDDDDDDEDEDDEEDPCTENIGEFGELDSQMNELQMELGVSLMASAADGRRSPLFSVFRD